MEQPSDATYVDRNHQLPPPHERPHRSLTANILIWLLILGFFAGLFWLVLRKHSAPAGNAGRHGPAGTVTATVVTAYKGDLGVYLESIGTVTPVYTDSITSQVSGLVAAVHYREGQLVRRGDLLVQIDPRPYQAQLMEAQGALQRDKALLAQAVMDEQRYRDAWAKNAIAKQVLDDQEKLVQQYEGTVKLDEGTVAYDQVQVSFCSLTAPISGRVGLRLIDPGNVVQANSTNPVVVITQLQPITVVFTIAEDSIAQVEAQLRRGHTLEVTALDRGNQTLLARGKLETVDNQVDTTTGTLKLRAVFPNTDNALFPNLFVNARLLVTTLHGVTIVSNDAIQQNGDVSFVYVIQNGVAHMRNVKPGVTDSGRTQVEGLEPGDVVADSSFEKLQNGAKVKIVQAKAPASTVVGNQAP